MFEHVRIDLMKNWRVRTSVGSDMLECGVTQAPRGTGREWRSKFEGSDAISVYFCHSITHTKWKRTHFWNASAARQSLEIKVTVLFLISKARVMPN